MKKINLLEYAISLNDYKKRVDGLRLQLIENWCLCKYCQLFEPKNINYNHWIIELRAHMDNIKSLNIKQGNKLKTLKLMFIDNYDFDELNTIYRIIIGKFHRENITNSNYIGAVCVEFIESIDFFINALANDNLITDDYIKQTFNY